MRDVPDLELIVLFFLSFYIRTCFFPREPAVFACNSVCTNYFPLVLSRLCLSASFITIPSRSLHSHSTYCPPELPAGAFLATQVDLFAAGVILYTMLVGVYPFRRVNFNFEDGGANYEMICAGRLIELARSQCLNSACAICHSGNVADGSCRVSPAAASLIQRLLARLPQDRLTMAALLQTVYMTTDEPDSNPDDEVWPAEDEE